ncbi:NS7 protein [Triaenops bat coronavirus]|nr:NS7 protein [Triaenops bat coronavirus]
MCVSILLFCRTFVCWISQLPVLNLVSVDLFGNSQLINNPHGPSLHCAHGNSHCYFSSNCLLHFPAGPNSAGCCSTGVVGASLSSAIRKAKAS